MHNHLMKAHVQGYDRFLKRRELIRLSFWPAVCAYRSLVKGYALTRRGQHHFSPRFLSQGPGWRSGWVARIRLAIKRQLRFLSRLNTPALYVHAYIMPTIRFGRQHANWKS
jgi:hypothetical protein